VPNRGYFRAILAMDVISRRYHLQIQVSALVGKTILLFVSVTTKSKIRVAAVGKPTCMFVCMRAEGTT
jgi:hypothetical protein